MSLGPPPYGIRLTYRDSALPPGILANVDAPVDSTTEHGLVAELAGWVAHFDDAAGDPPVSVAVTVGPYGWLEAPLELSRPDVRQAQLAETGRACVSDKCGFSILLPAHLVRAGGPYVLSVRRASGGILHEFAEITFESLATSAWHMPTSVQPLIVNSIGRTGSSLLCRMLSKHLAMHVPKNRTQYGEVPICGYVSRMLSVVSSSGSYALLNPPNTLPDFYSLEPPHFASRLLRAPGAEEFQHNHIVRTLTDGARHFSARVLLDYVSFVRSMQPTVRFLVEKSWNSYNINALGLLFADVKEVFVVREPVAFLESQRAFLLKEAMSEAEIEARHATAPNRLGNLARSWSDRRGKAHLVKYEDLIATPSKVLEGLCDYLGLFRSTEFIDEATAMVGDNSAHSRMLRTDAHVSADRTFESYLSTFDEMERANARAYLKEFGY